MSEVNIPLVLPVLAYHDPDAAIAWLRRVFLFTEQSRMVRRDGTVAIADLRTSSGGSLMIERMSPKLREWHEPLLLAPRQPTDVVWPDSVTVIVTDVDALYEHVRAEGAAIRAEPKDQPWGLRDFETVDLEGRPWNFGRHLRRIQPEDWGATAARD